MGVPRDETKGNLEKREGALFVVKDHSQVGDQADVQSIKRFTAAGIKSIMA
jgi:hypothetical protein